MEEYPGFSETPSPLPQKIETLAILKLVTSAIKITEKVIIVKTLPSNNATCANNILSEKLTFRLYIFYKNYNFPSARSNEGVEGVLLFTRKPRYPS